MLPIVADAEAGFGGSLNAFELMKAMIEAGAAGVHFEDQLSSAKKCGHMGGKVLVPTREAVQKLLAARLAADVLWRADDPDRPHRRQRRATADERLRSRRSPFITGEKTVEGFCRIQGGLDIAIARGLAYAPYCDLIWCETSEPNFEEAERFATAIHARLPGQAARLQLLAFLQLESEAEGRGHRFVPGHASASWATSSSSSRLPASTR